MLNRAWSLLADPGKWLSYDEQMIKSTARAMFSLMRFNKCKPIKHGEFFHDDATLSPLSSARGGGGSTMVGVLMMRNNTPARSSYSTYFSTTSPRGNTAVGGEQRKTVKHMYTHIVYIPTFDTVTNMTCDACYRMFWLEAMRHVVVGGLSRCVGSVVLPNDSLRQINPLTTKHTGICLLYTSPSPRDRG